MREKDATALATAAERIAELEVDDMGQKLGKVEITGNLKNNSLTESHVANPLNNF